jgi:hypothetical protein
MPVHHADGDNLVKTLQVTINYDDTNGTVSLGSVDNEILLLRGYLAPKTTWDAVSATIRVGVSGDLGSVFGTSLFNVGDFTVYDSILGNFIAADTELFLDLNAGTGGTQGESVFVMEYVDV